MCSNMCARPVLPMGSCTEPASTWVKNEKTGASGRSRITTVRPLGRVLTVMRFSKDATSCAQATTVRRRSKYERANCRVFHRTSTASGHGLTNSIPRLDGPETGKKFHSTWEERRMSNGGESPVASLQSPGNAVVGRRSSVVGSNIKHLISAGVVVGIVVEFVAILSGGRGVTRASGRQLGDFARGGC